MHLHYDWYLIFLVQFECAACRFCWLFVYYIKINFTWRLMEFEKLLI